MYRVARTLKAGLVFLAFGGAVLASAAPADAGSSTGTWRNGMRAGPIGPNYYGQRGGYSGPERSYAPRRYDGGQGYGEGRRGYDGRRYGDGRRGYREERIYQQPYGRTPGYFGGDD
jgi:hypothetical protein